MPNTPTRQGDLEEARRELEEKRRDLEEARRELEVERRDLEDEKRSILEGVVLGKRPSAFDKLKSDIDRWERDRRRRNEERRKLEEERRELDEGRQKLEEERRELDEGRQKLEEERRELEEDRLEPNKGRRAREEWQQYHEAMRIEETDDMEGVEFEQFIKTLLQRHDYQSLQDTPVSGDQGCDLLGYSPDNRKTVVQTKRWKGPVGTQAIQELLGALLFYGAELGMVFTNSRFTDGATALAAKDPRITLIDRATLSKMVRDAFPREVPEFNWGDYHKYVKDWVTYRCAAHKRHPGVQEGTEDGGHFIYS